MYVPHQILVLLTVPSLIVIVSSVIFPLPRKGRFLHMYGFFFPKSDVLLDKAALDKKTNSKSTSLELFWLKRTFLNDKQALLQFVPKSHCPFVSSFL